MIDLLYAAGALLILAASIGLLRFGERENIVYARIHLAGVIDVVCIFLTLIMGYPLIALTYLVVVPLSGHAAKVHGAFLLMTCSAPWP